MNVAAAPCPVCAAAPGCLTVTVRLVAKPLGSFSLAGAQVKVSAEECPVLHCSACGLEVVGRFDGDRHHAVFPDPRAASQ